MEVGIGAAYLQETLVLAGQRSRISWERVPRFCPSMEVLESVLSCCLVGHSSLVFLCFVTFCVLELHQVCKFEFGGGVGLIACRVWRIGVHITSVKADNIFFLIL